MSNKSAAQDEASDLLVNLDKTARKLSEYAFELSEGCDPDDISEFSAKIYADLDLERQRAEKSVAERIEELLNQVAERPEQSAYIDLEEQVSHLEARVAELDDENDDLSTERLDLQEKYDAAVAELADASVEISRLRAALEKYQEHD